MKATGKRSNPISGGRKPYRKQSIAAIRESAARTEAAVPPRPMLRWRDRQHQGVMHLEAGMCVLCFGFADDPRHFGRALLVTRFGFSSLSSIFAVQRSDPA